MVICRRWLGQGLSLGFGASLLILLLRPLQAQTALYQPLPLALNQTLTDVLSPQDIPTGEGGFARDYQVQLQASDQIVIDLQSNEFDTLLVLIAEDGSSLGANDDSAEGGSNSLLFARIPTAGRYIVRVRAFGVGGGGRFHLNVTRLRPMD